MPYTYSKAASLQNEKLVGDGECVALVKIKAGAPRTLLWREGAKVRGNLALPPGTAIATFVDGRYPNSAHGNHAALYLGQDSSGIQVMDQWRSRNKVAKRTIFFRGASSAVDRSDNGDCFSVIE